MPTTVTKKDGTTVPFDESKIKNAIMEAGHDADWPEEKTMEVAEKVVPIVVATLSGDPIQSSEIKEKVLAELDVEAPVLADAWRNYDASKE